MKTGYPIFVFDKQEVSVAQGKVQNVSIPHLDGHYGSSTEMVVDVTVECEGNTKSYVFKENTEIGYFNNMVISTGRDGILREVEAMKLQSEQALSQVEKHQKNVDKCTTILSEFNPTLKEKKEYDERFNKIEKSMSEMKDMMTSFIKEFKS